FGQDGRLQYVSAWALGAARERAAVPYLLMMLGQNDLGMKTVAAWSLAQIGVAEGTADAIIAMLRDDDMFLPSILIDLYRKDPATVRAAINRGLKTGFPKQKETLSWIAAVLRDPELRPALEDVSEGSDPRARDAASFALEAMDGSAIPQQRTDAS